MSLSNDLTALSVCLFICLFVYLFVQVNSSAERTTHVDGMKIVVLDLPAGNQTNVPVSSSTLSSHEASGSSEFEVQVKKTSMSLGLRIEGGSDTEQKDITVKNVKVSGCLV